MESNFLEKTKVSTKLNKNKKGEITSTSYSTAIPKAVRNKLGLKQGQVLYWNIDNNNNIVITPELPETQSIEAGMEILNDILFNGFTKNYTQHSKKIIETLDLNLSKEAKVDELTHHYSTLDNPEKYEFTKVLTYLLDYSLNKDNQYEILQEVYNQITQTD